VEQDRADPDLMAEAKVVRAVEERLELSDRLALVVEYGPAAAHPAPLDNRPAGGNGAGVRPHPAPGLAAQSVGTAEPSPQPRVCRRLVHMRFACDRRRVGGKSAITS